MATLLRMEDICKHFGEVVANDHVDFEVEEGEIHALLGENGAGKTTLMNILYGLYRPDHGRIWLRGRPVDISSPRVAISLGIGMIHQHFMLVPVFTVAENVLLGMPAPREPLLTLKQVAERVQHLSQQYGLMVDPYARVEDLAVGERQRVEILKALYRQADLLILDEPTAVLTPGEVEKLFTVLRNLTRQGKSVVFISHKLDEVMAISDRITVLRDGRVVQTVARKDTDKAALARMMVGREVVFRISRPETCRGEDVVLRVEGLTVQRRGERPALADINFCVRAGEIFAIAGVDGNGQRELAAVISGLEKPTFGRVEIEGQDVTALGPRGLVRLGVARIPEDRHGLGLVMGFTVGENLVLDCFDQSPFCRLGWLNFRAIWRRAMTLCQEYDIRPQQPDFPARLLSGGNQQKLILARELSRQPRFVLAVQPTRGLDVGASEFVYRNLLEQRQRGAGILLISTELDEVLMLADRIAVIHGGRIMDILERDEADLERLGLLMAGVAAVQRRAVAVAPEE